MAAANEERLRSTLAIEKSILDELCQPDLKDFSSTLHIISDFRLLCQGIILDEIGSAVTSATEERLWSIHGRINNHYRRYLKQFRKGHGRKNVVERRKAEKSFLDFIKPSQRFYRGFVQTLASRFEGIQELSAVADRLTLPILSLEEPVLAEGQTRLSALRSCHRALINLGDLSRWRETQLVDKERNWEPAIGYYDLASRIYPAAGASHNQLAVIALAEKDHLAAMYHLYRAILVQEPYPSAEGNLELEFRKIMERCKGNSLPTDSVLATTNASSRCTVNFVLELHARYSTGVFPQEHDPTENSLFQHLEKDLRKEPNFDKVLMKIILINIGAEFLSIRQVQQMPESAEILNQFLSLQRLNIKTFSAILSSFMQDLGQVISENAVYSSDISISEPHTVPIATRRLLPGMRQYSSWLITNAEILAAPVANDGLSSEKRVLWKAYAKTLSLLKSAFPVEMLQVPMDYLLEEDEETLNFTPFDGERVRPRYFTEDGSSPKPRFHDRGVLKQDPNKENLGRIRDLLADGVIIHFTEGIPIEYDGENGQFRYTDDFDGPNKTSDARTLSRAEENQNPDRGHDQRFKQLSRVDSNPNFMDLDTNRMVDDLVNSNSDDDIDLLPNVIKSNPRTDFVDQVATTPNVLIAEPDPNITTYFGNSPTQPALASPFLVTEFEQSVFTPQPGEKPYYSRLSNQEVPQSFQRIPHDISSSTEQANAAHLPSNGSWIPTPTPHNRSNEGPMLPGLKTNHQNPRYRTYAIQKAADETVFISSRDLPKSNYGDEVGPTPSSPGPLG